MVATVLDMPQSQVETAGRGSVVNRVVGDATVVSDVARSALPKFVSGLLTVLCTLRQRRHPRPAAGGGDAGGAADLDRQHPRLRPPLDPPLRATARSRRRAEPDAAGQRVRCAHRRRPGHRREARGLGRGTLARRPRRRPAHLHRPHPVLGAAHRSRTAVAAGRAHRQHPAGRRRWTDPRRGGLGGAVHAAAVRTGQRPALPARRRAAGARRADAPGRHRRRAAQRPVPERLGRSTARSRCAGSPTPTATTPSCTR